jgi:titin
LTWTDNANNETAFRVERATNAAGPWTTLITTIPASAGTGGTVTYQDTRAARGTLYYYRVRASNIIGSSGPSNQVSITTQA